jgi:hypothetical protein
MSFLTDLFHGNIGNLGRDITQAPSSLARHPSEELELGLGAAAAAAPFLLPELGVAGGGLAGLFGAGDAALPAAAAPISGELDLASLGIDPTAISAQGGDASGFLGLGQGNVYDPNAFALGNQTIPINPSAGFPDTTFGGVTPVASSTPNTFPLDAMASTGGDTGAYPATSEQFGPSITDTQRAALPGTNDPSFLSRLGTGAVKSITNNPLGIAAGAAGLGYSMLQGQKQLPEQKQLAAEAAPLTAQGQQFMQYLQSGTLPAGMQAAVDRAKASARATIIANHAKNHESTDPTQNSALAQELAQVDQNTLITIAQQGQTLFQAGLSEAQLSSQILQGLLQVDQQQTAAMGKAIANFASSLAGGGPRINIGGQSQNA